MNRTKIDKRNIEDVLALTAMQAGMLFHYLGNPGSKQYLEQVSLSLSGKMDSDRFRETWQWLARSHEMLRAVFRWEKVDEPIQVILKEKDIPVRVSDLSDKPEPARRSSLEEIIQRDREEKIDLTTEPLRLTLCLLKEDQSEMILTFHHILFDGWSLSILLGEFLDTYDRLCRGISPAPVARTRFKEYLGWLKTQDKARQDGFWQADLAGFADRTLLPTDKPRVQEIRHKETCSRELPKELVHRLHTCIQKNNFTLASLLFTAWGILLEKTNSSADVVFGTTVAGRTGAVKDIENMVGLFINTLPLRFQADGRMSTRQALAAVGHRLQERSAFEHTPLTDIKRFSGIGKESHLFDSIVVIDNYPLSRIKTGGLLQIRDYAIFEMTSFDLTVQVLPGAADQLGLHFHFNAEIFASDVIERLSIHFENILSAMVADLDREIATIEMLTEAETRQILQEFNTPDIAFQVEQTIVQAIETQVEKTPANPAVQYESQVLTYRELDDRADRLARELSQHGIQPGSRVALLLPRSVDMIVALLGILKAGAACIPLDPGYPRERNDFIIHDSGAEMVLGPQTVGANCCSPIQDIGAITLTTNPSPTEGRGGGRGERQFAPTDLAYIIYTSGSTGQPKGALLHHSGIVNHTRTKIGVLGITEADTVANNFSINVIASVWQILAPLFSGARLLVYAEEIEWDPYRQFQQVDADGVTVIEVIPPVLKAFLYVLEEGKENIALKGLRKIALTSEETKPPLVNQFYTHYRHIDLVDCYGQTECCDDVLHYTIPHDTQTQKVPIGRPALNTQVLILNHHRQLQPKGVAGEICVSGAGVGYGYWNRPELSAEKFVKNPINPDIPMYRTGDLGRWLADGRVEYLGRIDHQVKIRGNRIELREIENRLLAFPALREAAVVTRDDREGEKELYAFFVSQAEVTAASLRQFLQKDLPDYMVPAHFVPLEKMPQTANGKIDRKSLGKMEIKGFIGSGSIFKPPRSDYEIKIRATWAQLLDRPENDIGIADNFFDLGGHSLLLIKLKSKLEKHFDLKEELDIIALFNYPTIALQARAIEERLFAGPKAEESRPPQAAESAPVEASKPITGPDRDIAVIGLALRVPGATGIHEFWANVSQGKESISFFSEAELERSDVEEYIKGRSKLVPAGGILGDIDRFDADFFGFNPREAEIIDPQQRMFLEYAWMALEDAGYVGESYPGLIGVYAGVGMNMYLLNNIMSNPRIVQTLGEFQTMIGNDKDFLASRIAYKLNLRGPAITLQCACSSSLVAVHQARQAILNHDCDMALAGGIAVHVPEKTGYFYNEGGYLSPDGHCRAFDKDAQGTVFSNGIGIVVLKRLSSALVQGDHIYAVIKGSAINNDGSLKVGYTSPSEIGQADVILKALRDSTSDPAFIGYVETHGTGTVLGDPVEVAALKRAFRAASGNGDLGKQYCALGSLKANIGHLDIAAGVIGMIKAILCLVHRQIPPNINVAEPSPIIDFPATPFYINPSLSPWQRPNGRLRRAGVSSFGIGGTNAHVILEEAPEQAVAPGDTRVDAPAHHLVLLSARTPTALETMRNNLLARLESPQENGGQLNLADVAYTLQVGRKAFEHRLAFVGRGVSEAVSILKAVDPKKIVMHARTPGEKSVVWMFSGVGEHYVNMASHLYRRYPVFKEQVDSCCCILEPMLGLDLRTVIFAATTRPTGEKIDFKQLVRGQTQPLSPAEERLSQTIYAQTSVFVIGYSLAQLLRHWGIKPLALIGYSLGEYVAACLSGVFSLQDALFLVAGRAKLIQAVEPGAMTAISATEPDVLPILPDGVALVAVNAPELCIVSGTVSGIEELERQLKEQKTVFRRLKTFQAFHSPMLQVIEPDLVRLFSQVKLQSPVIPFVSNVSGTWISDEQATDPHYWVSHTVSPLRFSAGISELLGTSAHFFLEVGPGNSLCGFVAQHRQIRQGAKAERFVLNTLPKESENIDDEAFLLRTLGKMWAAGLEIDWPAFYRHERRYRLPLPTYPFERRRFWLDAGISRAMVEQTAPAPARVPGRIDKLADMSRWFYLPSWQQTMPARPVKENRLYKWLLFLDDSLFGPRLIREMKQRNVLGDVILVRAGQEFQVGQEEGAVLYRINPAHFPDYLALCQDLHQRGQGIDKIVHLWQWGDEPDFLNRGVFSLLYLVKALGKSAMFAAMDIWLVGRGLHQIERQDTIDPGKAAILGPARVVSQEYPNLLCRTIDFAQGDFGPGGEEQAIGQLFSEMLASPAERTIAYRGSSRWVQTYIPAPIEAGPAVPPVLREKGVYLITGGLGNIGLAISHYLARTVQARLVLTSRTAVNLADPDDPRVKKIKSLEDLGSQVLVVPAGASSLEQMQNAVRLAKERFGCLNGVLHAAGVMEERAFKLIAEAERADCELHFQSKIHGLSILDQVLAGQDLDFCILTSSLSPILGGLSLYAYSAANSFMDAFAHRQALVLGRKWLSINWADWQRPEPANPSCANLVLGSTVFQLNITPEEGQETFGRVLSLLVNGSRVPEIIISSGDLHKRLRQWVKDSEPESQTGPEGRGEGEQTAMIHQRPRLQSIYEAPTREAEKIVAEIWQELLGIDLVGVHDNFFELGGHSLVATRLISRLREIFRLDIPLPTLFEKPTVREVVGVIAQEWGDENTVDEIARTFREVYQA